LLSCAAAGFSLDPLAEAFEAIVAIGSVSVGRVRFETSKRHIGGQ
jgi:hypothetical protein